MSDRNTLGWNLTRAELVGELRRLRPALARLGITGVALFGSRARGDNREDSDIDLIIDVNGRQKFSLLDLVAVEQLVEDRLGLPGNVFMRRSLDPAFRRQARHEEVVIFND